MWAMPTNGSRWCSQMERKSMSRTSTSSPSSSAPSGNSVLPARWSSGSTASPAKYSVYACATRCGVFTRPGRDASSPIARMSSATAASMRSVSMDRPNAAGALVAAPSSSGSVCWWDTDPLRRALRGCDVGAFALPRGTSLLRRRGVDVPVDQVSVDGSLHGHRHRRLVRDRTFVARKPLRALRKLLHILEDLLELHVVEGLLLEQRRGEGVEDGPVLVEHLPGLVVRLLDQCAHLVVDLLRDALGVVALAAHVPAEEHLARAGAELHGADARAHAEFGDHLAGRVRGLLDVVGCAGRRVVEHDFLGDPAAHRV